MFRCVLPPVETVLPEIHVMSHAARLLRRSLRGALPALLVASLAHADAALEGVVTDGDSGLPLAGVNVGVAVLEAGTTTDAVGRYRLRLPEGTHEVSFRLIGFETRVDTVRLSHGTRTLDVALGTAPIGLGETLVQAERTWSAASSRAVRTFDLQVRPRISAHQMLQMAPGLIIAQHAGGGKAEQIFLRNFDADHGTDVAVTVDGMPVNMVSHGHGQGYADLHFLIPELVESLDVDKGPYFARHGNLATAGAIAYRTKSYLEDNLIRLEGGSFGTQQFTALYELPLADPDNTAWFAGNWYTTDGPVDDPQNLERLNVFARVHSHLSERSALTVDMGGFSSAWDASGQIPMRAIESGLIDRWGAIDPLEGGSTGRQTMNVTYRSSSEEGDITTRFWAQNYDFKLFSNFTFYLEDPVRGDMIEQTDERTLMGVDNRFSRFHTVASLPAQTTLGGGLRADNADVALWKSPGRERQQVLVDSRVLERNLYLWGEQQLFLSDRWRLVLGLRGDYFTFNVEDRLEGQPADLPHASGYAQDALLSPKAGLVFSPTRHLDLFVNAGTGFHSNDARDVVLDRRAGTLARGWRAAGLTDAAIDDSLLARNIDPGHLDLGTLPRAVGAEVGTRLRMSHGVNLGAAAWWLDLDEEFVYVGDGGMTEPSGRTRRLGVDLEARARLTDWLWADADLTLSDGILRDEPSGADHIPLAPNLSSQGGLTARHDSGIEGSLRWRHVGDRPANEDDSVHAEGYTVLDLSAAWRVGRYRVHAQVENLLDTEWNEAQFDTESRLPGEAEPVSELHITPGNPIGLRLGVGYLF
jgi:outer membrane receptor protein involved in Fe transport